MPNRVLKKRMVLIVYQRKTEMTRWKDGGQRAEDGRQIENKHEIRSTKSSAVLRTPFGGHLTVKTNSNNQNLKFKRRLLCVARNDFFNRFLGSAALGMTFVCVVLGMTTENIEYSTGNSE